MNTDKTSLPALYYYDINSRVYDMGGVKKSSPYEEGYYRRLEIVSENEKEYVCNVGVVNKKTMMYARGRGWGKIMVYTEKQKNDAVYIAEQGHKIRDRMRGLSADELRRVEAILIENGL